MSIHAALHHVTHYQYDRPVQLGPQVIRLRPAPHTRGNIISYALHIEPAAHFINWQQDAFSNHLARVVFPEPVTQFKVTVDVVVEMAVYNPFDFFLEPQAEQFPFAYSAALTEELAPYLVKDAATPLFTHYAGSLDLKPRATIDFLVELNQQVQRDVDYLIRMEPGVQTPEQTLKLRSGSCRDSAWLLVQLLRHVGLAARFVSGYLIQLAPDVKSLDGPSGTTVDFTDLHAWCEVYLPGAGWIGLDATSGLLAGEGHIPLACSPSPSSAAPIEGLMDEAEVVFAHEMKVSRIHESPRVTKPYTETQWADVLALGEAVDQRLQAADVRLTMGGEPTFVATTDRDAPEWNTDALGPTKRAYATALTHRLREAYGQGGFLHYGQGKWYPGEQLPRWALSIYWRTDGQPIWHNPALFADERETGLRYTSADAQTFITHLAAQLGVSPDFVQPGYEDTYYYLWRERRLPVNVDPFDAKLDDELERTRLHRVFTQGLSATVGYVLPLQPDPQQPGQWSSGSWFLRDDRLLLVPGDSPMGYRLPIDSQPWVKAEDYPYVVEQDPMRIDTALPSAQSLQARYGRPLSPDSSSTAAHAARMQATAAPPQAAPVRMQSAHAVTDSERVPQRQESANWITRTALCVEARDPRRANGPVAEQQGQSSSVLYVFMPPLARAEDYLALLSAVEATAQALGMRIVLEGYPPPRDPRLQLLQVTPDPGVIEVNIHPAKNWAELVEHTEFLYEAAYQTRLCAEKFMTDGRHTGTGGGNHIVLGGATPADSPFLRRPDVLASLLLYWHNHPSLSYLFSGLFIGPTSQSPRVDEARNDQVYELEIALQELHRQRQHGNSITPELLDRTLRNILVDITGNTHRSEFSIDKLASPDSPTGRLGLLELRAFEMPPHARMSVAQQLLLRALVARFWEQPYQATATRWGTTLHDRCLLPSFVEQDFADVLTELRQSGFAFQDDWFAPHFAFRFPQVGSIRRMGMQLTLRHALEPWHVMGEESTRGGTARFVDSSLERLEVRVQGLNESRYVVTVNGQVLPLAPTGVEGEFVAGVRYKAWNPPSALHPSIAPHAPLVFDLVDTWMQRSIGGCQYHVAHPGGRNYTTFPINAYEAESRRLARFFASGHTAGTLVTPPANIHSVGSREFPLTLDLRRRP